MAREPVLSPKAGKTRSSGGKVKDNLELVLCSSKKKPGAGTLLYSALKKKGGAPGVGTLLVSTINQGSQNLVRWSQGLRKRRMSRPVRTKSASPAVAELELLKGVSGAEELAPWLAEAAYDPELTRKDIQIVKLKYGYGYMSALDERDVPKWMSFPYSLENFEIDKIEDLKKTEDMMSKVHEMRSSIVTDAEFSGKRILGAIVFEDSMDRDIEGMPLGDYLWKKRGIVPFVKIDGGPVVREEEGVQLMKEWGESEEARIDKAVEKGFFGTKMSALILSNNKGGIEKLVHQQFEWVQRINARGLVPIVEIAVGLQAIDKAETEETLLAALQDGLAKLGPDDNVIFKLTPAKSGRFYRSIQEDPHVVRCVYVSAVYSRAGACERLKQWIREDSQPSEKFSNVLLYTRLCTFS